MGYLRNLVYGKKKHKRQFENPRANLDLQKYFRCKK